MRVVTAPLDNVDVTVIDAAGAFAPALVLVVVCGDELESATGFVVTGADVVAEDVVDVLDEVADDVVDVLDEVALESGVELEVELLPDVVVVPGSEDVVVVACPFVGV